MTDQRRHFFHGGSSVLMSLVVLIGGGCGGGSRGTGSGGGLRDMYESSFIGEPARQPGSSIFNQRDDDSDRRQADPCPLRRPEGETDCYSRIKVLQECLRELGKVAEDRGTAECIGMDTIAPAVRHEMNLNPGACPKIRKLCVDDFGYGG